MSRFIWLVRREIWERAGGTFRDDCTYSMDYELWLRFARHGARLCVLGRPLARFRLHGAQKTADAARYQEEMAALRRDFTEQNGTPWTPPRPQRMRNTMRVAVLDGSEGGSAEATAIAACLRKMLAQNVAGPVRDLQFVLGGPDRCGPAPQFGVEVLQSLNRRPDPFGDPAKIDRRRQRDRFVPDRFNRVDVHAVLRRIAGNDDGGEDERHIVACFAR